MKLRKENRELMRKLAIERKISADLRGKYLKSRVQIKNLKRKMERMAHHGLRYRATVGQIKKNQKNLRSPEIRRQCAEILNLQDESVKPVSVTSKYYRSSAYQKKMPHIDNKKRDKRQGVVNFYLQDEHSAPSPRVRDIVTRCGVAKRKRFLCDTLMNLHKKYCATVVDPVGKSLFYALKPFWVLRKDVNDRNTCSCRSHANFKFMLDRLFSLQISPTNNIVDLVPLFCCDVDEKKCVLRECADCCDREPLLGNKSVETGEKTWYYSWITKKIERQGAKNKMYIVSITERVKVLCTIDELLERLQNIIPKFFKHYFTTNHQFKALSGIKNDLKQDEILLIIDFSQNYASKYSEEIQATHFGASKTQISLHTGGFYYRDKNGMLLVKTFATVSDCLRHDAAAIWAHLSPIFRMIKEIVPDVKVINFQSDGPSTQYKNKSNFFFFRYFSNALKMKSCTWNFTASGHGKSVADAVGAHVKSLCDRSVANGTDILHAEDVATTVNKSSQKITVQVVSQESMTDMDGLLPKKLTAVKESASVHQIGWGCKTKTELFFRTLSCLECPGDKDCPHHGLKKSVLGSGKGKPQMSKKIKTTETRKPKRLESKKSRE